MTSSTVRPFDRDTKTTELPGRPFADTKEVGLSDLDILVRALRVAEEYLEEGRYPEAVGFLSASVRTFLAFAKHG